MADIRNSSIDNAYQWERHFHVPLTIALHLSRQQRFAEAQQLLQRVFDPAEGTLRLDSALPAEGVPADPSRPHVVARHRPEAYRRKALMSYLDNLIAWGDSLMREDSASSVNEAHQLFLHAADVLGPRPAPVQRDEEKVPLTYASLRTRLTEVVAEREAELVVPRAAVEVGEQPAALQSLYFGAPPDAKLLSYWDTLADRLFKVRHSRHTRGAGSGAGSVATFEPPVDAALLTRAAAAGLDVTAVVGGAHQPLPLVRFATLIRQAQEAVTEVKTLGAQLLSALEEGDAEQLRQLRSRHEQALAQLAGAVRHTRWKEATRQREALEQHGTEPQLAAALLHEALAQHEHALHLRQAAHSAEVEQFLAGEQHLHAWLKREVRGLYRQGLQLAFDAARRAERALQHELGDPTLSFLPAGYAGGLEGLMATERLALDLQRMELAYHELNHREFELTKHMSLRQIDPLALIQLRRTGQCTVELAEQVFDMDAPGHYFRRIREVSITMPCGAGPLTSVTCTLTLLRSTIRRNPQLLDGVYGRDGDGDERFSDHFGSLQSIVTSDARQDPGVFSTDGERYLPFEGAGAVSQWRLTLPAAVPQFDYATISDVVVHLRYTARDGGKLLREAAVAGVRTSAQDGVMRVLSLRHDFPFAWDAFKATGEIAVDLAPQHYPYWTQQLLGEPALRSVRIIAAGDGPPITVSGQQAPLTYDSGLDARAGLVELTGDDVALGRFERQLSTGDVSDLWLAITLRRSP